jgi:hypothetical protein
MTQENISNDEAKAGAKEQFDKIANAETPVPRLRAVLLHAFMARIDPPLQSDADYKQVFGVPKARFDSIVNPFYRPS